MAINFPVLLLAALIPMVVGFIWYHPKVMGKMWMEAAQMTEEKIKGGNMALIFGLSFVFAFLLAFLVSGMVIHQNGVYSIFFGDFENPALQEFMDNFGDRFRTFKHGALHGTIGGLFFALPIMATNAMFERKSAKYVFVNVAYWTITLALMGGVICQYY